MKEPKGPGTIVELMARFPDEVACVEFLRKLRWPDGFVCPRCGKRESGTIKTRRLEQCRSCCYQASLTARTVFHRTRKPMRLWFLAIFFVERHKTLAPSLEPHSRSGGCGRASPARGHWAPRCSIVGT